MLAHKWEYRIIWLVIMGLLFYRQLYDTDRDRWWWIGMAVYLFMYSVVFYVWWRLDVLEEFELLVREAIGDDALQAVITARLLMTTQDIAMLNRVMRRYDIMEVPPFDLPPEARYLRRILDDLTK